ncbi:L-lactate dehydrogenase [Ornithinimicrobium sp. INDO-MA30-4]|uniref:L-lactate dehydrogenase n=1 Tax=Ornithinimicrobium sp. INDO-MA30-4 TaxID=2908651 RepID=UPI001F008199|nr:L-lactate dehydrogenase [Ornithinimicrobium sp. INDO-MA30-4]UJH69938.1 L-lactate dehydrogenase [Ornithinimicrobium sp. INDO-MA30-4]
MSFPPVGPPKVAIVGAGSVGATLAYAALLRGIARRIALYDIDKTKVEAEAADISHGLAFSPVGEIVGSDDIEVCRDAQVVVITAGGKQKPGQSRMELAEGTVNLTKTLMPQLLEVAPDATYLMVTNPVDVVTMAALKVSGLPRQQVFGSGTVLDTARFRYEIGKHIDVAAQSVHAYIVGEHGDTEFPLWTAARVGGVPLLEWQRDHAKLTITERDAIADNVLNSAYSIIAGKGATNYAVALACVRILESVLRDENRVLSVSTWVDDYLGVKDVCLSVPTVVGKQGADERLVLPMSPDELSRLHASAESIKNTARKFGF